MGDSDRAVRARLRRAQGQLGGVLRMVEEGRSCEEIVTQLMAVRQAVEHAAVEIVAAHLDECLTSLPPEQARERASHAVKLLGRLG